MTGRFVVLEGGEGSGKSTQARRLAEHLRELGREVVLTFEPGATERGRRLREALLDDDTALDPRAELLLMAADRAQHVAEVIRPALERGADVISDRFTPSSLAYQGEARGLGVQKAAHISRFATGGLAPDLVIVLDVPAEAAEARVGAPRDRFERAGTGFHAAVRAAYLHLAADEGWVVVDGTGPVDEVAARVRALVDPLLGP